MAWAVSIQPSNHRCMLIPHLSEPQPVLDATGACLMVLGGRPNDPAWDSLQHQACNDIDGAKEHCTFTAEQLRHRRGLYPSLSIGVLFGGGQVCSGNLRNSKKSSTALQSLISKPFFRCMAGFSDNTFGTFYPETYEDYATVLDALCADNPSLRRNFIECIWAAATINFSPDAYTNPHTDFLNLVHGMYAVWALGHFDPKKGGHLVIWDLKLVIEFPPGSCILLLSALLEHSNLPIRKGEHRCSFVMYTAAGLFHWVENGMMSDIEYVQTAEGAQEWRER
ncbi:hypothetical protein EV421DRAFT_1714328 [Armillaria borealis]|uniref:Uncharacterized protein n=1 Tax=Armillaria borealis TaxID=47425 RepID=A0AA39J919_9AGAR|nr:hypothetical protein EV421DRAFT_1714328 [Armillaria borealis]